MRQSYREARPRKKRVLKPDVWELEGAEVEEPGDIDIKDVEFRLSNNSQQVQASDCMVDHPRKTHGPKAAYNA
jgi:hypothetical protein